MNPDFKRRLVRNLWQAAFFSLLVSTILLWSTVKGTIEAIPDKGYLQIYGTLFFLAILLAWIRRD